MSTTSCHGLLKSPFSISAMKLPQLGACINKKKYFLRYKCPESAY